jgi:hypothetical protein
MTFGLLNLVMLFGLAAVAIPPLIHLLNRRRYDVVDWGAMQFLQISETKRRRLLIEEILLMALRMGLIAVMVLALCAPFAIGELFSWMGWRQNRDVVLVFGGSASMGVTGGHEQAKEWALRLVDELAPGDTVTILQAKKQVVRVLGEPTGDFTLVRRAIRELPPPGGGCDWPTAVAEAHQILDKSKRPLRSIILLGDGQRNGWGDEESIGAWQAVAGRLAGDPDLRPQVVCVNFDPERPARPVNFSLAALRAQRVTAYIRQDIELETDLRVHGRTAYLPPQALTVEVDGGRDGRRALRFPGKDDVNKGQQEAAADGSAKTGTREDRLVVPLPPFKQAFKAPGSHVVSVVARVRRPSDQARLAELESAIRWLEAELKTAKKKEPSRVSRLPVLPEALRRPLLKGALARLRAQRDDLKGPHAEVRQDLAVEILPLPVLIVDGDEERPDGKRRSDFLRLALDPRKDAAAEPPTALTVTVVPADRFKPEMLLPPAGQKDPEKDPRVLILANVPRLIDKQRQAVGQFLEAGGGLLITLGDRVEKNRDYYNEELYRGGEGWLPARLEQIKKAGVRPDARPMVSTFSHSALELFRQEAFGGLNDAAFPRWWEVRPTGGKGKGVAVARLTTREPFIVEGSYRGGRVLLCTVPLMNSRDNRETAWDTNLVRLPAFAPLAHELVYYLAGNLSTAEKSEMPVRYNLRPGQPLIYPLDGTEADENWTLQTPGRPPRPLVFEAGPQGLDVLRAVRNDNPGPSAANRPTVEYQDTLSTGVYTLRIPRKEDWIPSEIGRFFHGVLSARRVVYYTVQADDPEEFDLTPLTEAQRTRVAELVPLSYETDANRLLARLVEEANTQEMWWILMLVVVLLLCGEVWLTRRIARAR